MRRHGVCSWVRQPRGTVRGPRPRELAATSPSPGRPRPRAGGVRPRHRPGLRTPSAGRRLFRGATLAACRGAARPARVGGLLAARAERVSAVRQARQAATVSRGARAGTALRSTPAGTRPPVHTPWHALDPIRCAGVGERFRTRGRHRTHPSASRRRVVSMPGVAAPRYARTAPATVRPQPRFSARARPHAGWSSDRRGPGRWGMVGAPLSAVCSARADTALVAVAREEVVGTGSPRRRGRRWPRGRAGRGAACR